MSCLFFKKFWVRLWKDLARASSEEALKNIFTEIGISWDSILPVVETTPDLWGEKWQEHLEREAIADTLGN